MRRFWLEPQNWENEYLEISGELYHHIADVCRFGLSDRFELLETRRAHFVEVVSLDKRKIRVKRLETREIQDLPRPHLHMALSLPRFAKVDWIVEKSVELGVYSLHPFVSDYSFVRSVEQVPKVKIERWRKLVRQACQQAGRGQLMEVMRVSTLDELLAQANQRPGALCLFPFEGDCRRTLKERLQELKCDKFEEIWVFVGSEGGFSRSEVEKFKSRGIEPVSLGSQVLRVETACLALASILQYEFEVVEHGSV